MKRTLSLVLVRTEGAVNIGLSARAMKNFGAGRLILVQPSADHLGKEALGYAPHARDILEAAKVYARLDEALEPFDLVLGFSRREGHYRKRDLFLKETPSFLEGHGAKNVALMLGNEKSGLSEEELQRAHLCISIESSESHPSLNLSHAAALGLYTLAQAKEPPSSSADSEDIKEVSQEFFRLLDSAEYFEKEERRELFAPYLQKIMTRGIREKTDALVVKNLLLRLNGIMKRKSGGK